MRPIQYRIRAGKANYDGSALQVRNAALHRAARLDVVRRSKVKPGDSIRLDSERVLTVQDYCQAGEQSMAQVDKNREPYLLIQDQCNAGYFLTVPIYDCRARQPEKEKRCWIDVHCGELLVNSDTIVYWK
jgi:hypothetical protein